MLQSQREIILMESLLTLLVRVIKFYLNYFTSWRSLDLTVALMLTLA